MSGASAADIQTAGSVGGHVFEDQEADYCFDFAASRACMAFR